MKDRSEAAARIEAAVTRFEGPLTQYAARLLCGDADRARDVVQDTFLKLWTVDPTAVDGHLPAWLYRVCRNAALDVRRKEVRMTMLQDNPSDAIDRRLRRDADPDALPIGRHDATTGVMALVEQLPDRQQEVLRLKFQGGLSYAEIAEVMNLTANHVGVLIHNAIKAIRERVGSCKPAAFVHAHEGSGPAA